MTIAANIKASAIDAIEAVNMAEEQAIALDQDWAAESSTYTFDDNSTLTVCGPDLNAKNNYDEA